MMYIHEAYRESDDDKLTPVKSLLDKRVVIMILKQFECEIVFENLNKNKDL